MREQRTENPSSLKLRRAGREQRKNIFLTTVCLLLATVFTGCATAPYVYDVRLEETVTIDGTSYVSTQLLCQAYNLSKQWDPIAKRLILARGDQEVRMMANSSIVLLNETVHTMDKEARFYQEALFIPQSFAQKRLTPLFREKYIKKRSIPSKISGPIKSVIIDPGHGGKDPGAIGRGGLKEKDVVLDIAKRLQRKLNAAGVKVIMTRQSDRFVSLAQRSKIANANLKKTDFFISIHANAARSRWVNGVEVFYLSETIDDNLRCSWAAKSYDLDLREDFSGKNTEAILWDLIFKENRTSSINLAGLTCHYLSRKLSQRNRGAKPARFYVLKGTNIPAVLIEVGFISNRREEKRLRKTSYRNKISQAITDSIIQYNRNFGKSYTAHY